MESTFTGRQHDFWAPKKLFSFCFLSAVLSSSLPSPWNLPFLTPPSTSYRHISHKPTPKNRKSKLHPFAKRAIRCLQRRVGHALAHSLDRITMGLQ